MIDSTAITLRHFEVLVAVAETGSFSRAGERLKLAQPTVSGHVAGLEGLLGIRLFDRGSAATPTPAGRALLPRAREALRARDRALSEALAASGTVYGDLEIAASNIPSAYLLPPIVAAFLGKHEGARVRLWTGDSATATERVRSGDAEVGAVGRATEDEALTAFPFAEDRIVLVVPAADPLAARAEIRPEDLRGRPFVLRERGSGTGEAASKALAAAGLDERHDLRVACRADSTEAVREAVAAGVGLAFLSDRAVSAQDRRIRVVRIRGVALRRTFYLVHLAKRTLSLAASEFLDAARRAGPTA